MTGFSEFPPVDAHNALTESTNFASSNCRSTLYFRRTTVLFERSPSLPLCQCQDESPAASPWCLQLWSKSLCHCSSDRLDRAGSSVFRRQQREQYVSLPLSTKVSAKTSTGRSQATPLTAWLRIPLDWFSSATIAQFPDESHTSIRRIFTPEHQPHCKRVFCGFCGTHISYWTEEPPEEADYLSVTLGSLLGDDIRALQELDLLPEDMEPEGVGATNGGNDNRAVTTQQQQESDQAVTRRSHRQGRLGDLDWFEEMLDGSRLGRTQKTRRGKGSNADGTMTVQWEVSEYREGDSEPSNPAGGSSKRKIGDVSSDDVAMRG